MTDKTAPSPTPVLGEPATLTSHWLTPGPRDSGANPASPSRPLENPAPKPASRPMGASPRQLGDGRVLSPMGGYGLPGLGLPGQAQLSGEEWRERVETQRASPKQHFCHPSRTLTVPLLHLHPWGPIHGLTHTMSSVKISILLNIHA